MIERLMITTLILGCLSLLWLGWHWYKTRLAQTIRPLEATNGLPTLLWFTADYCVPCKLQQAPIVAELANKLGSAVTIKKIDASQNPDLVDHYKVLTLPTTIILNETGQVSHINYGVTAQTKLEAQLM